MGSTKALQQTYNLKAGPRHCMQPFKTGMGKCWEHTSKRKIQNILCLVFLINVFNPVKREMCSLRLHLCIFWVSEKAALSLVP